MSDGIFKQMSRKVVEGINEPLRETMIARNLMYFDTRYKGLGVSNIQSPKYTDMKAAEIMYRMPDGTLPRDKVAPSMDETRIVTLVDGFEIPRDEFEAFKDKGIMMDTANALSASEKVIQRENDFLLNGWKRDGSAYEISGLSEGEGTNELTSKDFDTNGNAYDKVALAKAALFAAGVSATSFHLVLNPTQYGQLDGSVSTAGIEEMLQVKRQLGPRGNVWQSSDCSASFGLLLPDDPAGKYFRAYMPHPTTITFGYDSIVGQDISPIYGTVMERIGIHISRSTAICKLSNI